MKAFFLTIIIIFSLKTLQAQHMLGVGLGFDPLAPKTDPPYADKDFGINYSYGYKNFSLEARQAVRYVGYGNRFNTFGLIGFTTKRQKTFFFNFLIGASFSFMTNQNEKHYSHYYPQVRPTIKTGLYVKPSKNRLLYIGLESLVSSYVEHSIGFTGGDRTEGDFTGTVMLSLNYQFKKKLKPLPVSEL
jgi:outer membrane protease